MYQIYCKHKHTQTHKLMPSLSTRKKQCPVTCTCPEGYPKSQEGKNCVFSVNAICSFLFLQHIGGSESTNVRIPPEEGHVMSRSLLVFFVCRRGKIFGRAWGKRRAQGNFEAPCKCGVAEFTVFAEVESGRKPRTLNLCASYMFRV